MSAAEGSSGGPNDAVLRDTSVEAVMKHASVQLPVEDAMNEPPEPASVTVSGTEPVSGSAQSGGTLSSASPQLQDQAPGVAAANSLPAGIRAAQPAATDLLDMQAEHNSDSCDALARPWK